MYLKKFFGISIVSTKTMDYLWGTNKTTLPVTPGLREHVTLRNVNENQSPSEKKVDITIPSPPYKPPQKTLGDIAKEKVIAYRKNRELRIQDLIEANFLRIQDAVLERSEKGLLTADLSLFGDVSPECTDETLKEHFEGGKQLRRQEKQTILAEITKRCKAHKLYISHTPQYRLHILWDDPNSEYKWIAKTFKIDDEEYIKYTKQSRVANTKK